MEKVTVSSTEIAAVINYLSSVPKHLPTGVYHYKSR